MRNQRCITGFFAAGLLALAAGEAHAAPNLRIQVDQKGDFVLLGNTLGFECGGGTPNPVVGNVGNCGNNGLGDSAPDVFWRADAPGNGQAQANNNITVAQARSTAVLAIPPGATITHAFLYWGASLAVPGADTTVTLDRVGGFSSTVTAVQSYQGPNNAYQSVADVTAVVQANGPGAYRVSGVDSANLVNVNNNTNFAGWWMAVFYSNPAAPLRNLALFDGLDGVDGVNPQNVNLSGFLVPNAGFDGRLGVITFEGDNSINGDQLFFNGGAALANAQNPANNFFNGTRSLLGAAVSVAGDLPQLTGTAQSMSGMDLDVVDVTAKLSAGQTSAAIQATSTGDVYYLAGFITSISTFKPDFASSTKSAADVNGGALVAGDVIEYTVVATNNGNDTAVNVVLTDALPAGVTYVPGSLQITSGANTGAKTDLAADDQGEYDAGTNSVVFRLGAGANGAQGGTMAIGESSTIKFQVTIDADASGTISNQAVITASGLLGAPPSDTPTDGNGGGAGQPPTDILIDACADDSNCPANTPKCDTSQDPNVCVQCLTDADCSGLTPTCDPATNTCVCVPTGAETCDGLDNDCNGILDDGFDVGTMCSAGVGQCQTAGTIACDGMGGSACNAVAGSPQPEVCDGLDNNCDGTNDDGFALGQPCTSGLGICVASGLSICDGMGGLGCDAVPGQPQTEICGDALDSDCDGNPNNGCDDADGDGLLDSEEDTIGTDKNDADSDDDGVPDGAEPLYDTDSDGDGLINALDPDSDDDGLLDGTELGLDCSDPATDPAAQSCIPDGDSGATVTDPLDADTDDGGVSDGAEDVNLDGVVDAGETDPTVGNGADDPLNLDTDGDGLSDGLETFLGTDPNDADTDNDGVIDGQEQNLSVDTDGDGQINALDPDSDDDGLLDGTELGLLCDNPDTDASVCVPDGDGGATKTSPLDPDTDDGGVDDGIEDANHNGVIDAGETDPNDPSDDVPTVACQTDADCGGATSGKVCDDTHVCVDGCRGEGGNGCPDGQVCTSQDGNIGECVDGAGGSGGGTGSSSSGSTGGGTGDNTLDGPYAEGSGCACTVPAQGGEGLPRGLVLMAAGCAVALLRRRRAA